MSKGDWTTGIYGAASGLLLTIPHIWSIAAPLQLVALLPILYLATRQTTTYRRMIYAGFYMGTFYVLPQAYVLRMPLWISVILFTELAILFSIFASLSHRLLRNPTLAGTVALGASLVLLDWVNFSLVPIWGTAQSIVRPWSRYPRFISFIGVTGITGIIFLLGTLQGLIINATAGKKQRMRFVSAAVFIVFACAAADVFAQYQKTDNKIKVSAIGWSESSSDDSDRVNYPEDSNSLFAGLVKEAVQENSKLVVSPELGFYSASENTEQWLRNFKDIARDNKISLAIGYFCTEKNENRIILIDSNGRILGEYTKTHLIPYLERYKKGDSKPVISFVDGIKTGMMICQDDNFTDISRKYGREKVSLMAVPTKDWQEVKEAHFQNSINRAIESNYAVIRASINGISAIVSPNGEVLSKMDHLTEGTGIITAEVPLYTGGTLFSRLGHWPVVPSFAFLLAFLAKGIRSRKKSSKGASDLER
jgi:apolipoprotein N-acyltransferase